MKHNTPAEARSGPPPILTLEEESMLVNWIKHMSEIVLGSIIVKSILDKDKRPNPFLNNRPGRKWIQGFMNRHPDLTLRKSQALSIARALSCTPQVLDKWFDEFQAFLEEHNLLNKPSAIYNCDESGFPLMSRTGKVLAPAGIKVVNKLNSGNKQQITTLVCYNAAGEIIPPSHIFPGERFRENPIKGGVPNAYMGRSENGWMDSSLFYGWLANHFCNRIPSGRPVVLLVDGHGSHIDVELSKVAREKEILLYCLPPHCTHCLQPCDVGFFKPLKSNWDDAVEAWEVSHMGEVLSKYEFAPVFRTAWENTIKLSTLVNSFRATGICPLNRKAISDKVLSPSQIFREERKTASEEEDDIDSEREENGADAEKKSDCEEDGADAVKKSDCEEDDTDAEKNHDSEESSTEHSTPLTLEQLEAAIGLERLLLFTSRLEEGYDLQTDSVYNQWKALKQKNSLPTSSGHLTGNTSSNSSPAGGVSHSTSTVTPKTVRFHGSSVGSAKSNESSSSSPKQCLFPVKNVSLVFSEILTYPKTSQEREITHC